MIKTLSNLDYTFLDIGPFGLNPLSEQYLYLKHLLLPEIAAVVVDMINKIHIGAFDIMLNEVRDIVKNSYENIDEINIELYGQKTIQHQKNKWSPGNILCYKTQ